MPKSHQNNTFRETLRTIFRRRWLFGLGAALFALVSLVGAHHLPLKYTGTAKFDRRSENVGQSTDKRDSFEEMKPTLQLELAGTSAVAKAIEDLELTKGLPHGADGQLTAEGDARKRAMVEGFIKSIEVTWDAKSAIRDVISVSCTHEDRLVAERLPNLLVSNYINKVGEQIVDDKTLSRDFLLGKVKDCRLQEEEALREKTAFEVENAGKLPDSPASLEQSASGLKAEIAVIRRQKALAEAKLNAFRGHLSTSGPAERMPATSMPATSMPATASMPASASMPATDPSSQAGLMRAPNPAYLQASEELHIKKEALNVAIIIKEMKEAHPSVIDLRRQIAKLEKRLKETPPVIDALQTPEGAPSPELALQIVTAQTEYDQSSKELVRLEARLEDYDKVMANFGPIRQRYLELTKRLEEVRTNAARWEESLRDVERTLAAEVAKRRTHLNPLELAQPQARPSSPSLMRVLGFAIIGGLCFGAGLVFLANSMDRTIQTVDDASSHFDVPIHGAVGEIMTPRDVAMRRLRQWMLAPIISLFLLLVIGAATLSITLWLMYPQKYPEWRSSPVKFVASALSS